MSQLPQLNPKRIVFADSLAGVPMMGRIADHFQASAKADLRAEGVEKAAELAALRAQLDALGIQDPLPITCYDSKGREVQDITDPEACFKVTGWDGRHRTEWALEKGLKHVPVRIVTEAEGRSLLEATVVGRRHWTKGQLAWLAVTLNPGVAKNPEGRPKKNSDSVGVSAGSLGQRFGVSADLIDQAVKIWRCFEQVPTLREKHEPGIWVGHGLGAVLAGIPGATTTEGKPRQAISWTTMNGPLATLSRVGTAFDKFSADERDATRDALAAWLRKQPESFRLTFSEAVAQSAEDED